MKDPAFLFYYQDFAWGTRKMSFEEKGCYIELLCEQADTGHLSLDDIRRILKDSFPIWDTICNKFSKDADGNYYNEILEKHINKRRKYSESRISNLMSKHKESHMESHMESHKINININENEDVNLNVIKEESAERREFPTQKEVEDYFIGQLLPKEYGISFWSHYDSVGWIDGQGRKIKNWKSRVGIWVNNQKQFGNNKNGKGNNKDGATSEQLANIVARRFQRQKRN